MSSAAQRESYNDININKKDEHADERKHTFLNQTSKLVSSTGINGAGFWPGRCEIVKK
jgi:hypothetical protein